MAKCWPLPLPDVTRTSLQPFALASSLNAFAERLESTWRTTIAPTMSATTKPAMT
jgi:hypothetical protein